MAFGAAAVTDGGIVRVIPWRHGVALPISTMPDVDRRTDPFFDFELETSVGRASAQLIIRQWESAEACSERFD